MRLREICPSIRADVLKRWRAEWSLARKIQQVNFPVAGRFTVGSYCATFYPAKKTEARKLTLAVGKVFGVTKWEKGFSEWGGNYRYEAAVKMDGKINHEVELAISDAPQPKGCKIVEKTDLITKYESICNGEKNVTLSR